MQFSFATASQIIFGAGTAGQLAAQARARGRHILLVTGRTPERAAALIKDLEKEGLKWTGFQVAAEPDVDLMAHGADLARTRGCDLVIGFGGGSAIDAAKAIAALMTNSGPVRNYLEVIGKALPLQHTPVPCIAVPTTAGTGSEVTRNAVLRCSRQRIKVSMRNPRMLPDLAVVDPALTLDLPPAVTAATGFDALCQLLEAFVSKKANPMTDSLCREGLVRCAHSLETAFKNGRDMAARTDMSLASLFSGLALANAGLGAVHGIAGPLGGMHIAPHGAICARLLPFITAANIDALKSQPQPSPFVERYMEIARILTGRPQATLQQLIDKLHQMAATMQIPALSRWGLIPEEIPALATQALESSSMKGNPVTLDSDTLETVIARAQDKDN